MHPPRHSINPALQATGISATLHINEKSNRLIREGKRIYKFGLGESPFPVPGIVTEALKANAHRKSYLPVSGLPALQAGIADYLYRTRRLKYSPDDIMIGPGSKELLFILQLAYHADLILPTPSWVSYAPQARIADRRVHWLETNGSRQWKLTPEALHEHCKGEPERPRLLILNYPNNPHGYTHTVRELKELAETAAAHRVLIVSDEIYGGLHHTGGHSSIASHYPEGTVISDGLSKWCGAGGWRLGFLAFPRSLGWLKNAMAAVASETYTSVSAPIQHAAVRAFEGGPEIEKYLSDSRRILQSLGCFMAERLRSIGCSIADPEGAFYLFPDLSPFAEKFKTRGMHTGRELCDRLLEETGIAVLPGSAFGRPENEYTVRLSYVDFDGAKALDAAGQLPSTVPPDTAFLETCCANCVEGINVLCDWVVNA